MKKIIALILIVLSVFLLVACNGDKDKKTSSSTTTTTTTTTTKKDVTPEPDPTKDFEVVNEKVYVTSTELNIRKAPDADDAANVFKTVTENTELDRVAYNDTWSKVIIDGVEYYASSKYLTKQKPIEFNTVNETVYVIVEESIALREKTNFSSDVVVYLESREEVKRTGIAKEADLEGIIWNRIEVTVKVDEKDTTMVGYINSKYISANKDADLLKPDSKPQEEVDLTPYKFKDVNDKIVINVDSLSLRNAPTFDEGSLSGKAAKKGDILARVAVAEEVVDDVIWSKVKIDDKFYYISPGMKGEYFSVYTGAAQ